jgi:hypothetical protein
VIPLLGALAARPAPAAFDPSSVAGLLLNLDPSDPATVTTFEAPDDTRVRRLDDTSGNGFDLTTGGAGFALVTGASSMNSLNVLSVPDTGSETSSDLSGSITGFGPDITVFLTCRATNTYTGFQRFVHFSDFFQLRVGSNGVCKPYPASSFWTLSDLDGVNRMNQPLLLVVRADRTGAARVEYFINGTLVDDAGYAATPSTTQTFSYGRAGNTAFTGDAGQTLIYNAALSNPDLSDVSAGLIRKWGILQDA